jgi:methylated-DNA-[protein]-cysteine S-methyltransferase
MAHDKNPSERFAEAVDRLLEEGRPATTTCADPSLLGLAYRMWQTAPHALIDPHFRASLRRRLLRRKPASAPTRIRYTTLDTPVGRVHVAYRGRVIGAVGIDTAPDLFEQRGGERWGVRPARDAAPPAWLVTRVGNHLAGKRPFKGAVDLGGLTSFQQQVLEKVRHIPRGEVRPYTWVAREIGFPRAVRAVGTALGKNPIPLLIPCHRVIRSEGALGPYAAGGPVVKERLLRFEGIDVSELLQLGRLGKRFRGSRNTHIFCLPTCYSRKWAKERHTVYFASAAEARQAGYRPCKLCRPA